GYLTQSLKPTVALREQARQAAETALTLQPNLGEAVFAKGFYYYACLKNYDTAVNYFEQAHRLLPNNSRIPQSLAYVERRRGNWDKSDAYFNEAEKLDPRNVSLLSQHARSYVCLRRFPEALAKLEQILNITPDDIDTLVLKARIAQAEGDLPLTNMALGNNAAALTLAERAITMFPTDKDALTGPRPLDILARVAARIGDSDRSISTLEKLLSIPYEAPLAANPPLTPALLRLDPMFEPLRKDPRFQKLVDSGK